MLLDEVRASTAGKTPQGLAWILKNRKLRHAADVAATVVALPAKNWSWRPWKCLNWNFEELHQMLTTYEQGDYEDRV